MCTNTSEVCANYHLIPVVLHAMTQRRVQYPHHPLGIYGCPILCTTCSVHGRGAIRGLPGSAAGAGVPESLMFICRYSGVWSRTLLLPSPPARRNPNNYQRAHVGWWSLSAANRNQAWWNRRHRSRCFFPRWRWEALRGDEFIRMGTKLENNRKFVHALNMTWYLHDTKYIHNPSLFFLRLTGKRDGAAAQARLDKKTNLKHEQQTDGDKLACCVEAKRSLSMEQKWWVMIYIFLWMVLRELLTLTNRPSSPRSRPSCSWGISTPAPPTAQSPAWQTPRVSTMPTLPQT